VMEAVIYSAIMWRSDTHVLQHDTRGETFHVMDGVPEVS
jgi:hypothetical protein